MELKHIDIANLCVSAANMRAKGKSDIANILPSIRARGVLVPLIVRPSEDEHRFEIVAGKRRYHAAKALAEESGESEANESATGKVKRGIVRDCLTGENGRERQEGWVPKWMAFPPAAYTTRGGVATVSRAASVAELAGSPEPEPLRQAA